jgi:hypothetical protein
MSRLQAERLPQYQVPICRTLAGPLISHPPSDSIITPRCPRNPMLPPTTHHLQLPNIHPQAHKPPQTNFLSLIQIQAHKRPQTRARTKTVNSSLIRKAGRLFPVRNGPFQIQMPHRRTILGYLIARRLSQLLKGYKSLISQDLFRGLNLSLLRTRPRKINRRNLE